MSFSAVLKSPCGMLGIVSDETTLLAIKFLEPDALPVPAKTNIAKETVKQLKAYFLDSNKVFDLPLPESATIYQQRVRGGLQKIPRGQVLSYSALAKQIGSGARAVANACRHNPVPIVVPCHRIVAKAGIGGFSGATTGVLVENKRWLLNHEGAL